MTREEYNKERARLEECMMRCRKEGSINCAMAYADKICQLNRKEIAEESAKQDALTVNHRQCIQMLKLIQYISDGEEDKIQTIINEYERLRK